MDIAKNYLENTKFNKAKKEFDLPKSHLGKIERFYEYLNIVNP